MIPARVLTLFRVIAFPIILFGILHETLVSVSVALVFLILNLVSDGLRHFFIETNLKKGSGSFFDPFADKFLIAFVLFIFTFRAEFWLGAFMVFLLRDVFIGFIRYIAGRSDVAIYGGKISRMLVVVQDLLIVSLLFDKILFLQGLAALSLRLQVDPIIFVITVLAVILALLSVIYYLFSYVRGLHHRHKREIKVKREALVVLANRKSRGFHDGYRRRLLRLFTHRRHAPLIYLPTHQKNMFSGIDATMREVKQIIIAGGDGSFEGALNYRPFRSRSLGFFPLGAGNAYYSYFYKGKRFEYLRSQFDFKEINLDVLEVEWEGGKKQTTFLGIGIDAEVMRQSKTRSQHGFLDYVAGSYRTLVGVEGNFALWVQVDDEVFEWKNCPNLIFGKIPYLGFGVRSLVGDVVVDDGLVYGVACVNAHSAFFNKPLRLWGLFLGMMGVEKLPLVSLRGRNVFVKSEKPFALHAGGEFLGDVSWIRVRVVRKQKVLVI